MKIRYASKSWAQIQSERYYADWPSSNVKRSAVLIRFRKFIEGEKLDSVIIEEFLRSSQYWWLLTTSYAERKHAQDVLGRLYHLIRREEIRAEREES